MVRRMDREMDGWTDGQMDDRQNLDSILFRLNHMKFLPLLFKNDKILSFTQAKVFEGERHITMSAIYFEMHQKQRGLTDG